MRTVAVLATGTLLMGLSFPAQAGFLTACVDVYRHLTSTRKTPLQDNRIALLIYPFSAVLSVDEEAYDPKDGFSRDHSLEGHIASTTKGRKFFYSVGLRATESETDKLHAFVKHSRWPFQTCISGSCRALNRNLGFYIPPLVRWSPEFTLGYLAILKKLNLDHGRIESIRYYGNPATNPVPPYIASIALQAILSGLSVGVVYFLKTEIDAEKQRDRH